MADSGIWDRDDILDIAHIIRIEPLPAPLTPSTASANGAH